MKALLYFIQKRLFQLFIIIQKSICSRSNSFYPTTFRHSMMCIRKIYYHQSFKDVGASHTCGFNGEHLFHFTNPAFVVSVYEFPFFCSQGVAYHKKCHAVINLLRFIEFRALQCSNFKTILNLSLFMHFCWSSCNNSRWKHNKKKVSTTRYAWEFAFIVLMAAAREKEDKNNFRLSYKFNSQNMK